MLDSLKKLVPELGFSNVRVKDPQNVEKAVRTMMKDAQHKLQVIADFDWTLSKYSEDGNLCNTTHSVLGESKRMPEFYRKETKRLKEHYMPIEFDPSKTREEKIPKMIEWWSKNHALLKSCDLTKPQISTMVSESRARLRDGCKEFFHQLHTVEIPLLIFSAGLGDIISETIKQRATFYPENMKIVANFLEFDEMDKVIGFTGEIIHTFNKNENAVHSGDYFSNIRHRENLLLLGDTLGDLGMAKGADNIECILKIGFLNFKVEENLDVYMEHFDIVIVEDESLAVVNGLWQPVKDLQFLNFSSQALILSVHPFASCSVPWRLFLSVLLISFLAQTASLHFFGHIGFNFTPSQNVLLVHIAGGQFNQVISQARYSLGFVSQIPASTVPVPATVVPDTKGSSSGIGHQARQAGISQSLQQRQLRQ
ncbi:hypothetical protein RRG08_005899 [Elysia crispata]|uniref:5'-nucleotidase n=1 Tax=Elysia crispata TaxID=231223 RepID=A0AAE0Y4F9_9GAST|nr:hypothetical protein RRG08_005899 [Elysia crispata]